MRCPDSRTSWKLRRTGLRWNLGSWWINLRGLRSCFLRKMKRPLSPNSKKVPNTTRRWPTFRLRRTCIAGLLQKGILRLILRPSGIASWMSSLLRRKILKKALAKRSLMKVLLQLSWPDLLPVILHKLFHLGFALIISIIVNLCNWIFLCNVLYPDRFNPGLVNYILFT